MNLPVESDHRASLGIFQERRAGISILWWFLLPAAAVMTTDVWFTENKHLQLISLNVTGAMMDGFFAIWESKTFDSHSPITTLMHRLADVIRAFFLSTYTSWAGMVTFAATLSTRKGSIGWGFWYIIVSVVLGFLANGIGSSIAKKIAKQHKERRTTKIKLESQVQFLIHTVLVLLTIYIIITYALVVTHVRDFSDVFASARYFISSGVDDLQLLIAVVCSISGAYVGNFFGNLVDSRFNHWHSLLMGTLFCNTIFALLSLLLPILTLTQPTIWEGSLWLAPFSSSFCGAASAFAGHTSDLQMFYRKGNHKSAIENAIANIGASSIVLIIAIRFEHLVAEGIQEKISDEL